MALAKGYEELRQTTRHHAKSFYFVSHLLFGEQRRAAFALYGLCRKIDDIVDGDSGGNLRDNLNIARRAVSFLFQAKSASIAPADLRILSLSRDAAHAIEVSMHRFNVPEVAMQDLISGMEMDIDERVYENYEALDLYCHRAAGTVGIMMAHILGCRSAKAFVHAEQLGRAMQLTNILRDVREDFERGRMYLPSRERESFELTDEDFRMQRVTDKFVAFMRFQIARARALYRLADEGVPLIPGFMSRYMVRAMGAIYEEILAAIERQAFDVFGRRARVSFARKLWVGVKTLFGVTRPSGGFEQLSFAQSETRPLYPEQDRAPQGRVEVPIRKTVR